MKNSPHTRFLFIALATLPALVAMADSYTTSVIPANGQDFVAYCFQANTLSNALPSVPSGTTVYVYRGTNYVSSTYFGSWYPNLTLYPGEAFWIYNGTNAMSYTVHGTAVTNVAMTLTFTNANQWYGASFSYLGVSDFLECITNRCVSPTVHKSLQYHSNIGDLVYQWDVTNQVYKQYQVISDYCEGHMYTNLVGTPTLTYGTSPSLCAGKGIWICPATAGKEWIQYRDLSFRCCDTNCTGSPVCP